MSNNNPKIITAHELKHPLLIQLNLNKGDKINILKVQNDRGTPAAKKELEYLLQQKAIEAKIDLKIRKENAKLDIEIKEADFKIEKEREKLKNEKNQAVRDSLLQQEKEKIDLL